MYEYHGWITVRTKYENIETEDEDELLLKVVSEIKEHIINLNWGHGILDIRSINTEFHIWTSGYLNHKPLEKDSPVNFFRYVGRVAPGSYGILYIIDDYDMENNNHNKFKVYVLARGQLTIHEDPFLTPFVPIVESLPMD